MSKHAGTPKTLDDLCQHITKDVLTIMERSFLRHSPSVIREAIERSTKARVLDYIRNRLTPFTLEDSKNFVIYEHLTQDKK